MLKINKLKKCPNFSALNVIEKTGNRICYVLYSDRPHYIMGAIHNAIQIPKVYPGWIPRFYIERASSWCNILLDLNCEIYVAENPVIQPSYADPKIWNHLAINDPLVERVLFRDADAIVSEREKLAVDEWMASGKIAHRMKELYHVDDGPLMLGMWGIDSTRWNLPTMRSLIESYNWTSDPETDIQETAFPRPFDDEHFVTKTIWPHVQDNCLFHSVRDDRFGSASPFPCDFTATTKYSFDAAFVGSITYRHKDFGMGYTLRKGS